MSLLLGPFDMVNHDAEEQREADRRDHPGAAEICYELVTGIPDCRNKTQGHASDSSDRKSDEGARTALGLGQRYESEQSS